MVAIVFALGAIAGARWPGAQPAAPVITAGAPGTPAGDRPTDPYPASDDDRPPVITRAVDVPLLPAASVNADAVLTADAGLSRLGRDCIARMNALGILVDLSHVGLTSSWDALEASTQPVAITHSGARAIANHDRNKPDDLLKAVADRGGVVGAYMIVYLREEGQPRIGDLMRHLEHLLRVCGEDHVGIGSDLSTTPLDLTDEYRAQWRHSVEFRRQLGIGAKGESEDVYAYIPELNTPRRLDLLAAAMCRAGHSDKRIEKVLGGNWMRLLGDVWKG